MKNKFLLLIFFSIAFAPLQGGFLDWFWNNKLTTLFGATTVGFGVTTYLYSQKLNAMQNKLPVTEQNLTDASNKNEQFKKDQSNLAKELTQKEESFEKERTDMRSKLENTQQTIVKLTEYNETTAKEKETLTQEKNNLAEELLKIKLEKAQQIYQQSPASSSPSTPTSSIPSTPNSARRNSLTRQDSMETMSKKHELNAALTKILGPFLKPGQTIDCKSKTNPGHNPSKELEPFIVDTNNNKQVEASLVIGALANEYNALRDYFFKKHKVTFTTDENNGTPVISKHKFGNQKLSLAELVIKHNKELDDPSVKNKVKRAIQELQN